MATKKGKLQDADGNILYPETSIDKVNGLQTALDAKAAASAVPDSLADLTGDSTHRTVTDAEKTTWSAKEDASNKVTSLSSSSTNTQYPSAKLVYDQLATKAASSHTHTMSQITDFPSLATVATSGSYNDLSNKPTIPSEVTEATVAGWGFTKNVGTVVFTED